MYHTLTKKIFFRLKRRVFGETANILFDKVFYKKKGHKNSNEIPQTNRQTDRLRVDTHLNMHVLWEISIIC